MIKKRQHVVWKGYLKAWAKEGRIWLLHDGTIHCTSVSNVAVRKKFYYLKVLTPADYRLAVALLEKVAPDLRFLAKGWLQVYQQLPRLLGLAQDERLQDSKLGREIAVLVANFEEDLHAEIETASIPVLAALQDSDTALIREPESFMSFCLFVSAQMLRTPTDLALVQAYIDGSALEGDIQAVWGLLRTVFVGVMAFTLGKSRQRTKLTSPTHSPRSALRGGRRGVRRRALGLSACRRPRGFGDGSDAVGGRSRRVCHSGHPVSHRGRCVGGLGHGVGKRNGSSHARSVS